MCKSPSTETGRCKASLSYSLVWVILSALSLLSLSANAQTAMTGISISPASQTVVVDDEAEACFEISIIPQGADGSDVSSAQVTLSNPDVASIEGRKIERTIVSNLQSGQPYYMKLRPLKDGETDIEVTVTMNDETGFSATAKLIVEPKPVKHVTGIKFDTNWMDVTNTWDWWELKGTVTPFEPDNGKIHISMSNPIIKLDNTEINVYTEWHDGEDRSRFNVFWTEKNQGRPEFLSYGITKVTATTDDGGFTAECIINRPANAQIDGFHQVYFRDIYGNELAHETIKDGDAAIAPLSRLPEVNGREFLGWSDDFSHVTSDMVIYAIYSANAEMIDKPLVHFPDATMFYDYDGYGFKGAVDADGCTLIGDFSKNFSKAGEIDGLNIWSDVGGMYFIDDINADGKPDYFIRVDGNMGSRSYTTLVSEGNKYSWQEGVYIVPGMDLNSDGRIDHLSYGNGWYVCYAQPDGSFREEFMQIMSASEYESSFDPDAWASTAARTQTGLVANYGYVSGLSAVCLAKAPMRSDSRTSQTSGAPMRYDEVPAPTHCIDLNADGRMDLIDENQGIVYFNMGNAKWVVQSVGGSVLSADLNGDGFMDYVLPGEELVTMIYKNGGEFSTQTLYENIQVDKDMYCYDFDGDGDVDILVTFSAPYNATGFAYTMFFVNDGSGNFTQMDEQDYGDNLLVFKACQDADGDGIMDLVALRGTFSGGDLLTGDSVDVVLIKGTGSLSFRDPVKLFAVSTDPVLLGYGYESGLWETTASVYDISVEDIDNDGLMEIWASGRYNVYEEVYYDSWDNNHEYPQTRRCNYTYLYKVAGEANAAPSAPARPSVIYDNGILTVTWADGSDSRTGKQDLTYALRIGTTSGGMDILRPHSNADGSRRNFTDGEMGKLHSYSIDLGSYLPGKVYVAVQAIDAQHRGSAWSDEAVAENPSIPVNITISKDKINFNDSLTVGFTPLPDGYIRSWKCEDGEVVSQTASTAQIRFNSAGKKQITMTVTGPNDVIAQNSALVTVNGTGLGSSIHMDQNQYNMYGDMANVSYVADYTFDGYMDGAFQSTFYRGGENYSLSKASGLWATGLVINEGKWYDYDHNGAADFVFYNGSFYSRSNNGQYEEYLDGNSYYLPHNGTNNLKAKVEDDGVQRLFHNYNQFGNMIDFNHNGYYDYLSYDYNKSYPYPISMFSRLSDGTYSSNGESGIDYFNTDWSRTTYIDMDRDGYTDIVMLKGDDGRGYPYSAAVAFLNQGNGMFERLEIPFEQEIALEDMGNRYSTFEKSDCSGSTFADFNNDGFTDIFAWRNYDGAPYIMYNINNDHFSSPQILPYGEVESFKFSDDGRRYYSTWLFSYSFADVNNDGYLDIVSLQPVATAGNGIMGIYVHYMGRDGVKDQGFLAKEWKKNNYYSYSIASSNGLYNNFSLLQMPGKLLLLNLFMNPEERSEWYDDSGYHSEIIREAYYDCFPIEGSANIRPSAPSGVRAVQTADGLLIEWNDAQDDHTSGVQMRYNVSVKHAGQSGAGAFVISPQNGLNADAAYLPNYAYVKATRYLVPMSALSAGDYEIQIQAIDLWNSTSEFSEPVTVSIDRYVIDAPTLVSLGDEALITYMGNASAATPSWNFDGGTVVSGSGYGPYRVMWNDGGTKTISLTISGKTYERMIVVDVNDVEVSVPEYLFEGAVSQVDIPSGITVQWEVFIDGKYKRLTAGGINGTDSRLSVSDGKLKASKGNKSLGEVTLRLTLINTNGTRKVVEQQVSILSADNIPAVTLVTSDAQGHYVIGFQASSQYFAGVRIYKESNVSGQFIELGTVDPQTGSYTDPTSNSNIKAERYSIAGVMGNGAISPYSKVHQTVHMNINRGIQDNTYNLIWNGYKGADVVSYNILRGQSESELTQIASVSASNLSYTDVSPDAGKPYYAIEYVLANDASQAARRASGSIKGRSNAVSTQSVRNVTYVTGLSIMSASGSYKTTATTPSVYLYAEFSPVSATYKTLKWELISGADLATITDEGLLTAITPNRGGVVTVRATATDGTGVTATRQISIGSISCFTVTFTDWDGTVIDVQTVESGQGARLPDDPFRAGYKFAGWDKDVSVVTGNITVTALYVQQTAVEDVKAGNRRWDTYKVLDSEGKLYIVTPSGIYNTHGLRQK